MNNISGIKRTTWGLDSISGFQFISNFISNFSTLYSILVKLTIKYFQLSNFNSLKTYNNIYINENVTFLVRSFAYVSIIFPLTYLLIFIFCQSISHRKI